MKWFKHDSDFRQRPCMKFIQRRLGSEGVAAAYRLLEVMAESFRKNDNPDGTLRLAPPYTELWLADELGLIEDDGYGDYPSTKKLLQVLAIFNQVQFIAVSEKTENGSEYADDGTVKPCKVTWRTITVPGFVGMVDEYTARKVSKGLRSPD